MMTNVPTHSTAERLVDRYATVADVPVWVLTDTTFHTRHLVEFRRHAITLADASGFPTAAIAAVFNMHRTSIWRALQRHDDKVRTDPWFATYCAIIEEAM